jgi:hypothetical protein
MPGTLAADWARGQVGLLENVDDRRARDLDPQLPQLALEPGVARVGLAGDAEDDVADDLLEGLGSARAAFDLAASATLRPD